MLREAGRFMEGDIPRMGLDDKWEGKALNLWLFLFLSMGYGVMIWRRG